MSNTIGIDIWEIVENSAQLWGFTYEITRLLDKVTAEVKVTVWGLARNNKWNVQSGDSMELPIDFLRKLKNNQENLH